MKFELTHHNNFLRVFQLPTSYPDEFCFGGGLNITFKMVDWFNPLATLDFYETPKILEGEELEDLRRLLKNFISKKLYIVPGHKYLAITDYGDSFII